ncbi:MAG: glycosyltransferase [Muribaculaceae bacterium]|nr:glycosyltransferase [Muribaculaceae bacterium]
MKLSVLISVYKTERPELLKVALESIWDIQTYQPDEIILIKDGPLTHELDKVIDKFKLKVRDKLIILSNSENLGLTKSLNRGLSIVKSDFIARMDSDDISTSTRFQNQIDYLNNNPDVSIVGGALQEFDTEHDNLGIRVYPTTNDDIKKYIYKASPLAHPAVMMRKIIFDNGLSYNEKYKTSQDIALWFDALKAGYKIGNLNEIVLKFRRDNDVFKRRSRAKAKNELLIYLNGIRNLYGLFTWRYLFPIARFCFRMMPVSIVKYIYGTKIRTKILQ